MLRRFTLSCRTSAGFAAPTAASFVGSLRHASSTTAADGSNNISSGSDASRYMAPPSHRPPPIRAGAGPAQSESDRWWPVDDRYGITGLRRHVHNSSRPFDGMLVPEVKEVPNPSAPEKIDVGTEHYMVDAEVAMFGDVLEQDKKMLPPATFDPAIDDIEESEWADANTLREIARAAEQDRHRLESFGNPMSAADQVDLLMSPHRQTQDGIQQRQEFNGFLHWGLLKAADVALDQEADTKKAHTFVNRYLRDMDLFEQWLRHPKVVAHMYSKYKMNPADKFDKLMAISMALYVRSKVQCMEGDLGGALKSLVSASGLLHEAGTERLQLPRYKRALGGILMSRSGIYLKLGSPQRAEEDATRALTIVPRDKCASLYQIRADAREQLGMLAEAREDEEAAALIWERAETLSPGMDGQPIKYVY